MTSNAALTASLHFRMVLFVIAFCLLLLALGYRAGEPARKERVARIIGFALLGLWLVYNAYYFIPGNFQWAVSLPLHVCDALCPIAALALITNNRYARAALYFCAIPLAGQAIVTPVGNQDPATLRFWLYWSLHAGIIAASLYDVVIRNYRPDFKDLLRVLALDSLYVALIAPLDLLTGWNYGYLGNATPDVATALHFLGPWPARVGWLLLIVTVCQVLMYLPWRLRGSAAFVSLSTRAHK